MLRGVTFAGAFKEILHQVKPTLAENIRFGLSLTPERIARALELRGELFTRMRSFLERYDVLAAPVTQVPPFSVDEEFPRAIAGVEMGSYLEWFRSCSRITVTSHPAVAVPAGFTADGLPIGLQLVGRHRGEAALLALARAFTEATGLVRAEAVALMPWPATPPTAAHRAAFADASPHPFWLATVPDAQPALAGVTEADLCIVGGGFTGLWAALYAKALDPGRDVVLLEAETAGFGASRAQRRLLRRVADARDRERAGALRRGDGDARAARAGELRRARAPISDAHGIDCDFEPTGELAAFTDDYQLEWLAEGPQLLARYGYECEPFDAAAMRAEVASPTYVGGLWVKTGAAVLDPGKLAFGLRDGGAAARRARVRALRGA